MSERPRRTGAVSARRPATATRTRGIAKPPRAEATLKSASTEDIQNALSETPSKNNTLIVDGHVHRHSLLGIQPDQLVFIFYDTPKVWPEPDYQPTIQGYTLEEFNKGVVPDTSELEYFVVSKPHKFKGEKEKVDVFAVNYNNKQYKVKYAGVKSNGKPYFFIEYALDALSKDPKVKESGIRYYGEFMTKMVPDQGAMSFGRKKKKVSNLAKDLKYLLSL
jgi:hypothetical protein